ncbi:MAG: preprotein translocase subunit YajC [Gaiellaceae bacterium]|jgi:preprotein translocase subunit YajC|nr:preprotein translocase subunit YajC [Gaiellaceae bacterium]
MLIAAATSATTTTGTSSGGGSFFFVFVLLALALLWLIMIRPQRRKQKLQQTMQSDLAVGAEVLTAGGVYGTVTHIDDEDVRVEIAPNVEVRLARRAIAAQFTEPSAADPVEAESSDENPG